MAVSRLFILLGHSILHHPRSFSQPPLLKLNIACIPHSLRLKRCISSAVTLESETPALSEDAISAHPWPEWVNFVDQLKVKGYITQNAAAAENGGSTVEESAALYKELKLVKDACMSFARDRFDIFKLLPTSDIQAIVEQGCPSVFRKPVNSAKRLRAHLQIDEGDVCSSCSLRGSCDRAYVLLTETETAARTVDVVRMLMSFALDPLVVSGEVEDKPAGRELVESSARRLLSELVELSETPVDPDLPKPASVVHQKKKQLQFVDSSDSRSSKSIDLKPGDWVCTECNFMNFARNIRCLKCKANGPKASSMSTGGGGVEMKKGDWNCAQCSFMNFASNKQCFRCQGPRPPRQLKPGDWECPNCDFMNFSRNTVCKSCNRERPLGSALQDDLYTRKPY
ncbi:zinc finger protein VAR3, chloroplastic-like [Salvia divinorum]|uniref:Zinc finger protein VAR3, chloroplastic-like n=2 Tax=Salvia divinorum TaxID=28513 RepID=A0ABD1HB73_SALDI